MPNRMGDIFRVCRDASDNNKVHYALRYPFPVQDPSIFPLPIIYSMIFNRIQLV